jgi:hypothetical protein
VGATRIKREGEILLRGTLISIRQYDALFRICIPDCYVFKN